MINDEHVWWEWWRVEFHNNGDEPTQFWCSDGGEDVDVGLLGCDTARSCRWLIAFRRNLTFLPWKTSHVQITITGGRHQFRLGAGVARSVCVWQRTGRPRDRGSIPYRGERIFPLVSSLWALGPTQPLVHWVPGVLSPGVKRGQGVTPTTHPHLLPRSWMSRSCTSSPSSASMACSGTALLYFFTSSDYYLQKLSMNKIICNDLSDTTKINFQWL
jgi:hypothetical protein